MTSTELFTSTKQELDINFGAKEVKFINELKTLTDTRDNRGKRHSLVILIVTFVFATLVNRSSVSSIHRYMTNKIHWLSRCNCYFSCSFTPNAGSNRLAGIKYCD